MRSLRSISIASFVALVLAAAARAQLPLPIGDQQIANTTRIADQDEAVTAVDAQGNFLVVWRADDQDGNGAAIVARRFAARTGLPLSGEILINFSTLGDQENPAVAVADDGLFVVVWESPDASGSVGVFGSLRAADGTPIVQEFLVNQVTAGDQTNPSVAMRANGDFLVLWQNGSVNANGLGTNEDIFGRIFVIGTGPGQQFPVNRITLGDQEQPAAAANRVNGRWLTTWQGLDLVSSIASIFYLELLPDGPPAPGILEILLNLLTPGPRRHVAVAANATGEGVAVWEAPDVNGSGIFARRIANGQPTGQQEQVNLSVEGNQRDPSVAIDERGLFVTVWVNDLPAQAPLGSPIVVQGRKKASSSFALLPPPRDGEFQISTSGGNPEDPWVANTSRGNFVVAWQAEGVDDPPDPLGRAALYRLYADPIFAGDFETGDTSDWSSAIP